MSTNGPKLKEVLENPGGWAKDIVQSTLLKSQAPVAQIAAAIGKSDDRLYKSANRNSPDHHLHFKDLPILIHETGDLTILKELAAMFGFALAPLEVLEKLRELMGELEGK